MIFGWFALIFGTVTLVARFVAPHSRLFSKLEPMKQRFGDKAGTTLHVLAYTVLPLMLGGLTVAVTLLEANS